MSRTREKLGEAVGTLATDAAGIKERVEKTRISLAGVKPEDLPPSALEQFQNAMRKLEKPTLSVEEYVSVAGSIWGAFLALVRQ